MQIETRAIKSLNIYENNPRSNDHAVEKTAAAIKEFGFRVPVLIKSDGQVIDGHLRIKAANHIGLTEVPCLLADDMSDDQVRAFRISVNKVAELADWDAALLTQELAALETADFDLGIIGFDSSELDELLNPDGGTTRKDIVPDPPETPVSKTGDVWILGNHRVMCGDSLLKADINKLMGGGYC